MTGLDQLKRDQEDFKLYDPPPWDNAVRASPQALEDDAAAFMAAAASLPGGRG